MIKIEQLEYAVGDFRLGPLDLTIKRGEYFVLLGPPGSGKSMLIECLCGLRRPQCGHIRFDGKDITHAEPRRRGIGYVPQDYGLFPHLNVEQNIRYGLRGMSEAPERLRRIAGLLRIEHLFDRRIPGLSGGERQHVALARALVLEPRCLLLDEPVSALDEATRQEVCTTLKTLQQTLGIATVHVSHNREEAFSVADRAAILHEGALQQVGEMPELARKPINEYVARFMRCENILHGQAEPDRQGSIVRIGGLTLTVPDRPDGPVLCIIRPERIHIHPVEKGREPTSHVVAYHASIGHISDRGAYIRLALEGTINLIAHISPAQAEQQDLKRGKPVVIQMATDAFHILET